MVRRPQVIENAAAVGTDIRRDDMQMRMAGIDMPVRQPGLVGKADAADELFVLCVDHPAIH